MKINQIKLIEQEVVKFRQSTGLSDTEAINLKSLLLRLGVFVLFRPLSESFSGMSLKDSSNHRFMLINSNQSRGRQHFTIAHELYHLFIEENPKPHKCMTGNGSKSPAEQKADMFASILLMPENGIIQILPQKDIEKGDISLATVIKLEHYFSTSRAALLNRLSDLRLINAQSKAQYSSLPTIQSAKNYGYDTSLYKSGNENLVISDFGEKARILFESDRISEGHYIELLNKLDYGISKDEDCTGC
jgi:Zn-dependent peptidase ImmA (M78 family)